MRCLRRPKRLLPELDESQKVLGAMLLLRRDACDAGCGSKVTRKARSTFDAKSVEVSTT